MVPRNRSGSAVWGFFILAGLMLLIPAFSPVHAGPSMEDAMEPVAAFAGTGPPDQGSDSPSPVRGEGGGNPREEDGGDVIHFAASADQHYGSRKKPIPHQDGKTVDDWMSHPDLPPLDFVVASAGDWISDNRVDKYLDPDYTWQRIVRYNADRQKLPYFFVIGNHDITNYDHMPDGNPVRKERTGRDISGLNENNYAFLYKNVLFICAAQTTTLSSLSGFQKDWMEYLVDRYSDRTTVILTHQAMYRTNGGVGQSRPSSYTSNDYFVYTDWGWWSSLFDENPQIKLYIHGHTEAGVDTVSLDRNPESWDDNCTFVMVPSNGRANNSYSVEQHGWSYIFTIRDGSLEVRLWDSKTHSYGNVTTAGVPYVRDGMANDVREGGMEWFSIPKRVLDGQSWEWKNRMLAQDYLVELVGTDRTEQLDNWDLRLCHDTSETWGNRYKTYWYAVEGDGAAQNLGSGDGDNFIKIDGGHELRLRTSSTTEDRPVGGKVPYNTAVAVPGKEYNFTCRVSTLTGNGTVDLCASIPRYLDLTDLIWDNRTLKTGIPVNSTFRKCFGTFTVPDDGDAWFIQPRITFGPGYIYILDSWSLKMVGDGSRTTNFTVTLNGETHRCPGTLGPGGHSSFTLAKTTISNDLLFNCTIDGNRAGILRLIYQQPQFWSDDASIGVVDEAQETVRLEDVSPYNHHTSVMNFEGVLCVIEGLTPELVRGKLSHSTPLSDGSLDGEYGLVWDDTGAPSFGADMTPSPATTGDRLNLSIEVSDNTMVASVRAEFRVGSGPGLEWAMNGTGIYNLKIPIPGDARGEVEYSFRAEDPWGNWARSTERAVKIVDDDPPAFGCDATPSGAGTGDVHGFNVSVEDNIGVVGVSVEYAFSAEGAEGSGPWNATMQGDGGCYGLSIVVPPSSIGTISYRFHALDGAGNHNATDHRNVTVADNDPPWVEADRTPSHWTTGDDLTIAMKPGDNGGVSLVHCEFWFGDGEHRFQAMQPSEGNYTLRKRMKSDTTAPFHYVYHIRDLSGNEWSSAVRNVTVRDNDPPEIVSDRTADNVSTGRMLKWEVKVRDNIDVDTVAVEYWFGWGGPINSTMKDYGDIFTHRAWAPKNSTEPVGYVLWATDRRGNTINTSARTIAVLDDEEPRARAGGDLRVETGVPAGFNGSKSTDNVGVEDYVWTFEYGGEEVVLWGLAPSFTFFLPGEYRVELTVADGAGNTGGDSLRVTVYMTDRPVNVTLGPFLDGDGDAVEGVSVFVHVEGALFNATTGADGTAVIGLPQDSFGRELEFIILKAGYVTTSYFTVIGGDGTPEEDPPPIRVETVPGGGRGAGGEGAPDGPNGLTALFILGAVPGAVVAGATSALLINRKRRARDAGSKDGEGDGGGKGSEVVMGAPVPMVMKAEGPEGDGAEGPEGDGAEGPEGDGAEGPEGPGEAGGGAGEPGGPNGEKKSGAVEGRTEADGVTGTPEADGADKGGGES